MNKINLLLWACLLAFSLGFSLKEDPFFVYKTDSDIIYDICFTLKGEALAIADNNTIKVYATNSDKLLNEFKNGHRNQIIAIDISKDSTLLVSGGKDSTIVIWDFINNKVLKSLSYQKGIITSLQLSNGGKHLLSGGTDGNVYLYSVEQEKVVQTFNGHKGDVTSVSFSPNGELIAFAGADNLVKIYETATGKLLTALAGHSSWVRDLSFNHDGSKLISCGDDARVITWNTSQSENIQKLDDVRKGLGWILSVAYNEDGKAFVSGGIDGKVRITTQHITTSAKVGKPINKVLFKPNEGSYLKVTVATRGQGVIFIKDFNYELI